MSLVRLSAKLEAVLVLIQIGYIGVCNGQASNSTPIFIESIYEMNGEKCVIQEAAYSMDTTTKRLENRTQDDPILSLLPGTISHDDPSAPGGNAFSSAFSYVQNCSEDESVCTLELRLSKTACGSPTEENPSGGQHYIKYTNIHATGISVVRVLTDSGDTVREVTQASLLYNRQYSYSSEYKANTIVFQYNISDPEHYGYDFLVDACCVK